jgi:proteasome assembly chaperone (PAC2) family protein
MKRHDHKKDTIFLRGDKQDDGEKGQERVMEGKIKIHCSYV